MSRLWETVSIRKRIRDEGLKGSNEEEEIAQRQKPANNHMLCLWGGDTRKSLRRENRCRSMHTRKESSYKQQAALPPPPAWGYREKNWSTAITASPAAHPGRAAAERPREREWAGGDSPCCPRIPCLQPLPPALARPGQAQGATKLKMLLCLHQGERRNLEIFSVKEEKTTKTAKFLPSEGNHRFSCVLGLFFKISILSCAKAFAKHAVF